MHKEREMNLYPINILYWEVTEEIHWVNQTILSTTCIITINSILRKYSKLFWVVRERLPPENRVLFVKSLKLLPEESLRKKEKHHQLSLSQSARLESQPKRIIMLKKCCHISPRKRKLSSCSKADIWHILSTNTSASVLSLFSGNGWVYYRFCRDGIKYS